MEPPAQYRHDERILQQARRLYDPKWRQFAWDRRGAGGLEAWQAAARPALRALLGLDRMARELSGHVPRIRGGEPEVADGFTRSLWQVETEPDWWVEVWVLRPDGEGPFPLAIHPHGHEPRGHDTYAGVPGDSEHKRRRIAECDADVAVQAARHGFVALAVNTRGFADNCVPDLNARHGASDCRSESIHALMAGRTTIGERVWDLQRVLDIAADLPGVDASRTLMMGNSGGGVATLFAAACDDRIGAAVASCSFCVFAGDNGLAHLCDCNVVPGIYRFGEAWDVAGLIAPRPFLAVHGREDPLFPLPEVERTVAGTRRVFAEAGAAERFAHRWGTAGHRFYSAIMWPWVTAWAEAQAAAQ